MRGTCRGFLGLESLSVGEGERRERGVRKGRGGKGRGGLERWRQQKSPGRQGRGAGASPLPSVDSQCQMSRLAGFRQDSHRDR